MASKDKDIVPSLGSPWDAILQAAKDQLPSLDSDSSLSDFDEEEPFIFQRNQPVLIPDLAEELAEDPAGRDKSGTWVPGAKKPPPEVCGTQAKGTHDVWHLAGRREYVSVHSSRDSKHQYGSTVPKTAGLACGTLSPSTFRDKPKYSGAQLLSMCISSSLFQQLEEWDLDYILQSLPEREDNQGNCAPRTAWWAADSCRGEGLTLNTAAQVNPIVRTTCASIKLGFQAAQGQKLAGGVRPKTEPPTIFIDLRRTEPLEPQDQSPESSSHSSSDSGEEEDEDEYEEEDTAALGDHQGPAQQASLSSWGLR
ncbi:uncharacterized protein C16orf71 homolog [Heterocephalus glaber]|uniref:Dynein axonemal assembly factor 8 n=1 Tax=Heterocephalus glaber TaxID=10181 RepID=A0AAX6RW46_HETGA|nr:uncharacterized protein C16orf71 homolog [Heterocephalus glaber]